MTRFRSGIGRSPVFSSHRRFTTTPICSGTPTRRTRRRRLLPVPTTPSAWHGSTFNKPHWGIHGTPEPSMIGRTQSHGCVRMTNWDVRRLLEWAKTGTPVVFRMRRFDARPPEIICNDWPSRISASFTIGMMTRRDVDLACAARRDVHGCSRQRTPAPAHDPSEPRAVERPGEQGEAVPAALTGSAANATAIEMLRKRHLKIPVDVDRDELRDTFTDARGGSRAHEALDIMAPRHTPVRAVEDGRIQKLFTSKARRADDLPVRSFGDVHATTTRTWIDTPTTCAKDRLVKRRDVIGYVGSTGNASPDAPHLHFAIFRLDARAPVVEGRTDRSLSRVQREVNALTIRE